MRVRVVRHEAWRGARERRAPDHLASAVGGERRVVEDARDLVEPCQRGRLDVLRRERAVRRPVERHEPEAGPAAAPALPDEGVPAREEARRRGHVHPGRVLLDEEGRRGAGRGIAAAQLETALRPVEDRHEHALAVRRPGGPRDVHVVAHAEVEQDGRAALARDDPDARHGVGVARLRVPLLPHRAVRRHRVDQREARHVRLVERQVGEPRRVGRPPRGGPRVELLGVHPVEVAVADRVGAAGRQAALPWAVVGDLRREEVVVPAEGDAQAVGGHAHVRHRRGVLRDATLLPRREIDVHQVAARAEEECVAVGRPEVIGRAAAADALRRHLGLGRRADRVHLGAADEACRPARRRLHLPERRLRPASAPLHPGVAAGTPRSHAEAGARVGGACPDDPLERETRGGGARRGGRGGGVVSRVRRGCGCDPEPQGEAPGCEPSADGPGLPGARAGHRPLTLRRGGADRKGCDCRRGSLVFRSYSIGASPCRLLSRPPAPSLAPSPAAPLLAAVLLTVVLPAAVLPAAVLPAVVCATSRRAGGTPLRILNARPRPSCRFRRSPSTGSPPWSRSRFGCSHPPSGTRSHRAARSASPSCRATLLASLGVRDGDHVALWRSDAAEHGDLAAVADVGGRAALWRVYPEGDRLRLSTGDPVNARTTRAGARVRGVVVGVLRRFAD